MYTFAGQTSDVVMSTLFPEPKPFALQIVLAAETQSGAPFGAIRHFSWPLTARAVGMRATASAASLAPSTVVFAASLAALPKLSTFFRAFAVCSSNQRPTVAMKLSFSRAFWPGAACSCAAGRYQHERDGKRKAKGERSRPADVMEGRCPFDAHDWRKQAPGQAAECGHPFFAVGFTADRWRN